MWPPSAASHVNPNTKTTPQLSSSSSCSFSSSSVSLHQPLKLKTMEEVWKDINLDTLGCESQRPANVSGDHNHFFGTMILQDFLASAFKSPPSSAAAASELPLLHLPPTALSLSSGLVCPFTAQNLPRHAAAPALAPAPSCDRHKKRVMKMKKNRESAARSRARKQAYTTELELEVAQRAAENAKLEKQNEELRMAMASQISKKDFLHRTSSAPF